MADEPQPYRPRCMYLTCKSMLVYGEAFESDPDYQGGVVDWTCNMTCRSHGPDGGMVSLEACSAVERECFREY
jgi:hypothetical protein